MSKAKLKHKRNRYANQFLCIRFIVFSDYNINAGASIYFAMARNVKIYTLSKYE